MLLLHVGFVLKYESRKDTGVPVEPNAKSI